MKPRLLAALVALAAVAAGLWLWLGRDRGGPRSEIVLSGNVDIRQVQLAFYGSERIATVAVQEGDHVAKGQVLATLDTARLGVVAAERTAHVAAQREVLRR